MRLCRTSAASTTAPARTVGEKKITPRLRRKRSATSGSQSGPWAGMSSGAARATMPT